MNDLDLAPIEARLPEIRWNEHGAWLYGRLTDCIAEIRRLRADRDHAREWALYWRHNAMEGDDEADCWPEGDASDGWQAEPQAWEERED